MSTFNNRLCSQPRPSSGGAWSIEQILLEITQKKRYPYAHEC